MRILYCLLLLSFMVLSFGVDAQEDLQIKNNSGEVLMEVREDGMLIRRLSTSERMSYTPTSNDNGLLVYDTDTKRLLGMERHRMDSKWEEKARWSYLPILTLVRWSIMMAAIG
jgi:hypothetical protein